MRYLPDAAEQAAPCHKVFPGWAPYRRSVSGYRVQRRPMYVTVRSLVSVVTK